MEGQGEAVVVHVDHSNRHERLCEYSCDTEAVGLVVDEVGCRQRGEYLDCLHEFRRGCVDPIRVGYIDVRLQLLPHIDEVASWSILFLLMLLIPFSGFSQTDVLRCP